MSRSTSRTIVVVLGIGILIALALGPVTSALSQVRVQVQGRPLQPAGGPVPAAIQPVVPEDPNEFRADLTLQTDNRLSKKIEAAKDYMKDESWDEACHILQRLLEVNEDSWMPIKGTGADGKEKTYWASVRNEADRLLGTMPPKGLEFYKLHYGPPADALLQQATTNGDWDLLAKVARCYLYTDAGVQAVNMLATYKLDRREYAVAAVYFERLLNREGIDKLDETALLKAALSFRLGGGEKGPSLETLVWKKLEARAPDGLKLNGQTIPLETVRKELESYGHALVKAGIHDCPMFRYSASRNNQGIGGRAFLEPAWKQVTARQGDTKRKLSEAIQWQLGRHLPVLPAFFPVAATITTETDSIPLLLFRSYYGVHAVDIRTGKLRWECDSRWSMDYMFSDRKKVTHLQQWVDVFMRMGMHHLLWENSVTGTLSTDNQRVYIVDDLMVPPFNANAGYDNWGRPQPYFGSSDPAINDAVLHNELHAFDLKSGKILWQLGGRGERKDRPTNELQDSYFLGPPLPLGGKLYVLTEKNQDLRLVCLDTAKDPNKENPVVWIQTLAATRNKMVQDLSRRVQAVHLAYAEGILVCPTNAGAIFGVDLVSHSLVWAQPYREDKGATQTSEQQLQLQRLGRAVPTVMPRTTDWKTSAPVIEDGKVVFTAPDGVSIHCLRLRDGYPLWTAPRSENDLYLAGVYRGKVVIVTNKSVRSLNLEDGKPAWRDIETGTPSGQGVASDGIYYLPLKSSSQYKLPEICAIDMDKGTVVANTRARKKSSGETEEPGNLLFYEGLVISQTVNEVVAYPQLKRKIEEIDRSIAANPADPVGLTNRGELQLSEGNLQRAIDDLREALVHKPEPAMRAKARRLLHEALTEFLQRDFNAGEKYLTEYEELCKVDDPDMEGAARSDEEQRRLGHYLYLLAKGRENQGQLLEAFRAYMRFAKLAPKAELISSLDEPSVRSRPDVWAQGRISAMLSKATAEQRKPLEEQIAQEWERVKASKHDVQALTEFVTLFAPEFKVGREARLELAERLMNEEGNESFLAAENQLKQLEAQRGDPQLAARALDGLARLYGRKGRLEDVAFSYRKLNQQFGDIVVRDGKTGSDLFNELATDKRYLAYLDEPGQLWEGAKIKAQSDRSVHPVPMQQVYRFELEGEPLPFFRDHRLSLNLSTHEFRLTDLTTQEEWKQVLTKTQFSQFVWQWQNLPPGKFPFHAVGHLVVLRLGHMVFGIDPVNRKVLWEKNLYGSMMSANQAQVTLDPRDGALQVAYPDGWVQRLGQTGPIEANYVCLQTGSGLIAVDPVSGQTLWTRSDVPASSYVFGDAQRVYIVEGNQGQGVSRALRAEDGVAVDVPAFAGPFQNRIRTLGGKILVKEADNKGTTLRLYDVGTGKDVWKRSFPAESVVTHTEDPNLIGVIDPDGKLTAIEVATNRDLLQASLDPKHLRKALNIQLLEDQHLFYVLPNLPSDPAVNQFGGPWPSIQPWTGIRSLPVNGQVYAFEKTTGKLRWRADVPQQMVVLELYKELPILLFTSRYNKPLNNGPNRFGQPVTAVKSIDKRTGKLLFDEPEILGAPQFHTLLVDPKAGRIEFSAQNLKITHYLEGGAGGGDKVGAADPKPSGGQTSWVRDNVDPKLVETIRALQNQAPPTK
jgi:outer membrane protein assembly factor BamB